MLLVVSALLLGEGLVKMIEERKLACCPLCKGRGMGLVWELAEDLHAGLCFKCIERLELDVIFDKLIPEED